MFQQTSELTPSEFYETIDNIKWQNDMDSVDAVLYFCEQNCLEPEAVIPLLNQQLKSELKDNYIKLHYLPKSKTRKLPI